MFSGFLNRSEIRCRCNGIIYVLIKSTD